MTSVLTLLKAQHLNASCINKIRYERDRKKKNNAMMQVFAYIILGFVLVGYSFGMAYGYGLLGMINIVPVIAIVLTTVLNLMFTFFKSNSYLFGFSDYDQMMSLPVSTKAVITAKFLYMYLQNLKYSLGIMLPMGIGYFLMTGFSVGKAMLWLGLSLFVPLIPMTIAAIVGALIAFVGSGFRHKVLVQTILTIALFCGIMILSFSAGSIDEAALIEDIVAISKVAEAVLGKVYPPARWFGLAIREGTLGYGILFVVVSIAIYTVFCIVLSMKFRAINTALTTKQRGKVYQISDMKVNKPINTLIVKEWRRLLSSTAYLINMGMGLILAVLFTGALSVVGVDSIMAEIPLKGINDYAHYLAPCILMVIIGMTSTSSVSLSLEGKSIWILKSLPVSTKTILKSKILFNLMLQIPVAVICDVLLIIACKPDAITAILYFVVSLSMCTLLSVMGMFFGILFVNYEWANEVQVIKQSMAAFAGIFGSMIVSIVVCVAAAFLCTIVDGRIVLLLLSVVASVLAFLLWKVVERGKI